MQLQGLVNEEGREAQLWLNENGKPYVTDKSNFIVDLYSKIPIKDGPAAGKEISSLEGGVQHGDGKPYITDNSNFIVDSYFKTPIIKEISSLEGVVEHGEKTALV